MYEQYILPPVSPEELNASETTQVGLENYRGRINVGKGDYSIHVEKTQGIWIGADTFADAPFSVDMQGNVVAASITIDGYVIATKGTFGGNGSDGALSVTSGTTTIDLGSAAVVTKNYTSISITGTGAVNFTNPHAGGTVIILKSQGNVTLTSSAAPMLDASGMGAAGGPGGVGLADGTSGTVANDIVGGDSSNGKFGKGNPPTIGVGGVIYTSRGIYLVTTNRLYRNGIYLSAGSGGGGGGGTQFGENGGAGGRGGGCLYIQCGGAWNFTTASGISVAGAAGGAGTNGGIAEGSAGGGGGAGGFCLALYNTLTANSGTITISGGNGGVGGNGNSGGVGGAAPGAGGGAGMYNGAGGAGGLGGAAGNNPGASGSNGSNGSSGAGAGTGGTGGSSGGFGGAAGGGGGGGGTAGESLITQNIIFA